MASTSSSAFSQDGQYLAFCGTDGKLKIWETATNRLKQEFVPNLHLSSPCSVLDWIVVGAHATSTATSPWKKRRKKSVSEDVEHKEVVVMGSTNGTITVYDISTSSISDQLQNGHSSSITALTWNKNIGLFSAAEDKQIVHWNLQEKSVKCKWKSGKGKVTSLAVLSDGKTLLSGERMIKWWNLETKQVIGTFSSQANQVNILRSIKINEETSYLFSGGVGDNYVSVWALNEVNQDVSPVATLALLDESLSFSIKSMKDSQIWVLSVTRSGQAQLFKYQANGSSSKPIKPTLNICIASDAGQKESVQQIPIITAELTKDAKMMLAYGSLASMTIEKVLPDFSDKVQFLVRIDSKKSKIKKEESITKVKEIDTEEKVEYLGPGSDGTTGTSTAKRNKSGAGSQLPLKDRLENLSLDAETSTPNKSLLKGENMTQLLIQGLHSGDKNLLANVLYIKKESVINNTVARLPVQAIHPLLKELTSMLQGKTYPSTIAVLWLKALASTHAAQMISHPYIGESLAPILSFIDAKQQLLSEMTILKGRVELVTNQLSQRVEKEDVSEECLLVYQDEDSSEDIDINEVELSSESDDNWEETSDQEPMQEDIVNGESDESSMNSD